MTCQPQLTAPRASRVFIPVLALLITLLSAPQTLPAHAAAGTAPVCTPPAAIALTINVKDKGAKGDGRTNDTAAIQSAIDAAGWTGGTVYLPPGRYMVDAAGKQVLTLKSNMTLKLAPRAVLAVIPNKVKIYGLLTIKGVSNVTIDGGTLIGDRKKHGGTEGEWGMGIRIRDAQDIIVSNMDIREMWGDAIHMAGVRNVTVCGVTADSNRRQGISVVKADRVRITNSVFKNTRGTAPQAGIDLEPNKPEDKVSNVTIEYSKFIDNAGPGILIAGKKAVIARVFITHNLFKGRKPILIEYAKKVLDQTICFNRYVTPNSANPNALVETADDIPVVVTQDTCGDPRIIQRREK